MRTLGGSIGLAIAVIVFNSGVRHSTAISQAISSAQLRTLFQSPLVIETFSPAQQQLVTMAFAQAFTEQMRIATYIAAASVAVSLFTLRPGAERKTQTGEPPVVVHDAQASPR